MIVAGLAVLEGPIASLNARDEAGVNRFFNFPHVSFTGAGELKVFENSGDFDLSYFRERRELTAGKDAPGAAVRDRTRCASTPNSVGIAPLAAPGCRHVRPACVLYSAASLAIAASRSASFVKPSRVCGNLRSRMRDATTVRRICAVPPPIENIRPSRQKRSIGRRRE